MSTGRISFYIALFLISVCCEAQTIRFNQLTIDNGLSQNSVWAISQDSQGFIWFGTRFGLNRYDGHKIVNYYHDQKNPTTISDNYVFSLLSDSKQNLWVGTKKGLNLYNPKLNQFTAVSLRNASQKDTTPPITTLYEDRKGNIWIGGINLLAMAPKGSKNFKQVKFIADNTVPMSEWMVWDIYIDESSEIWLATTTGLKRIRSNGNEYVEKAYRNIPNNPNSLSTTFTSAIQPCEKGNMWIGTNEGLNHFNKFSEEFIRSNETIPGLSKSPIRRLLLQTKNKKLWIATKNGLQILDCVTKKVIEYNHNPNDKSTLSQSSLISLFKSRTDKIWLGTFWNGANLAYEEIGEFKCFTHSETDPSISHNIVSAVAEDENQNLWIGTEDGGLNYFDKLKKTFTIFKHDPNNPNGLPSNIVKKIYIDKSNGLWIGTHSKGMLYCYNKQQNTFSKVFIDSTVNTQKQYEVADIFEDSQDNFWVLLHYGVYVFKRNGTTLLPNPILNKFRHLKKVIFTCIIEDNNKTVWIGSEIGLFRYDLKNGQFKKIILKDNREKINCIIKDKQGNLWLGLKYDGFAKYNTKTDKASFHRIDNRLINNNVQSILEDDDGLLWISTSNGLVRFNPRDSSQFVYSTYNGLSSNEFNINASCKTKSNEMFFGSINGLICFNPKKIASPLNIAKLKLTRLVVDDKEIVLNEKLTHPIITNANSLTLKYNQNTFTVNFALLNYTNSNKNKYAYKLDKDGDWNYTSDPSATFINLSSGHYTLYIKGAKVDGIWSSPLEVKIEIRRPFWKTWWAYLFYAILTGSILFFIIRHFYQRGIWKREASLNQIKLNFFTNVSHEIRTHLTLVTAPIEKIYHENQSNFVLSHQIENIKNNAEKLIVLVNELMDFRKAESKHLQLKVAEHDLVAFATGIFASYTQLAIAKNIQFDILHASSSIPLFFDKEQLSKVVNNLLHNAFKFTPEGGSIKIVIEEYADKVVLRVTDNGRGIAAEMIDKIFTNYFQVDDNNSQNTGYGIGLALAKNITELHKGTLTAKSETFLETASNQTCFKVALFRGKAHFSPSQFLTTDSPPTIATYNLPAPIIELNPINSTTNNEGYTVLIVEDIQAIRQLVKDALGEGYIIVEAANGLEGLNIATEIIPDVIISDVMMPEMDGYTLINKLKTDERCNHIPIILLTARSSQTDQISGLTHGADLYLAKPFNSQVLCLSVYNMLQTRTHAAEKFKHQITLEPTNKLVNNNEEAFLNKLVEIIEENMDNTDFTVEKLAKAIAMSQSVLYKKLKALTGLSVNELIKSIRLKRAAQLLTQNKLSIFEISLMVGFNDRKYFSKEFRKQFGKSPSEFIQSEIN